jgi:putative peptide zinc metalloprotease protein
MSSALPTLRNDIRVVRGGDDVTGWPTYVLHDQVRGKYFHLGWPEFEVLSRWGLGTPEAIIGSVLRETTVAVDDVFVQDVAKFIQASGLAAPSSAEDIQRLDAARRAKDKGIATWLLHHYLFVRLPLLRSDHFITSLERALRPALRHVPTMLGGLGVAAFPILALQFEAFASTFPEQVSVTGLLAFALALTITKICHELGHAVALKHFGGVVPTMGVALLVLFPMLYTDTSSGWFLRSRRQRIIVAIAGIATELGLAALSVLIWAVMPDGAIKTAAFFVATTALVGSLLVNISPFMKFDGYYILADLLNVPNLHERAFAEGRDAIRNWLFGIPRPRRRSRLENLLLGYAVATWLYRLIVFTGIAVMVYQFAFKALGIILFLVEIWWFILRPVLTEVKAWHRDGLALPLRNKGILLVLLAGFLLLAALPWRQTVQAPAVMQAKPLHRVVAANPGRLLASHLTEGAVVASGALLYEVEELDLRHQVRLAGLDAQEALLRVERAQITSEFRGEASRAEQQLHRSRSELAGLAERASRAQVTSLVKGRLRDVRDGVVPGRWIGLGDQMAIVAGPEAEVVA